MYELWLVTGGSGEGELVLLDVKAKEDLPLQLRRRCRRVGAKSFATEAEANQFRRNYHAEQDLTIEASY